MVRLTPRNARTTLWPSGMSLVTSYTSTARGCVNIRSAYLCLGVGANYGIAPRPRARDAFCRGARISGSTIVVSVGPARARRSPYHLTGYDSSSDGWAADRTGRAPNRRGCYG